MSQTKRSRKWTIKMRWMDAARPTTSPDVLRAMAKTHRYDRNVFDRVLKNPNLPLDVFLNADSDDAWQLLKTNPAFRIHALIEPRLWQKDRDFAMKRLNGALYRLSSGYWLERAVEVVEMAAAEHPIAYLRLAADLLRRVEVEIAVDGERRGPVAGRSEHRLRRFWCLAEGTAMTALAREHGVTLCPKRSGDHVSSSDYRELICALLSVLGEVANGAVVAERLTQHLER